MHAITRLGVSLFLCLLFLAPGEAEASARAAAQASKKGLAAAKSKKWDEAVEHLRTAVKESPRTKRHKVNLSLALTQRAITRVQKGKYDAALPELTEAIELDSKNALAHRYRGFVHLRKRNWQKSLEDYNVAVKLKKKDREPLIRRAFVHLQLDDKEAAIKDYSAILKNEAKDVEALLGRGYLYEVTEKFDKALVDAEAILAIQPANKEALARKKRLLLKTGRVTPPPKPTPRLAPLKRKPVSATPTPATR